MRSNSDRLRILRQTSLSVKGKIYSANVKPAELAEATGYARSTVADYIAGRNRSPDGQLRILKAFNRLSGLHYTARQLWDEFTAREVA